MLFFCFFSYKVSVTLPYEKVKVIQAESEQKTGH